MRVFAACGAMVLALSAGPALAHHSYSMFDSAAVLTVQGTLKEVQWANPHIWLEITVASGPNAGDWSFEGGSVAIARRAGWSRDMFKVGDKITVTAHPLRNGSKGGSLMTVTPANGPKLFGGTRVGGGTNPDLVERQH